MADSVKRILIFGGTGMTGLAAVEQALKLSKEVVAFVRDPSKVPQEVLPRLHAVVQGDVTVKEDVERAVGQAGLDGVVVVLGTRNNLDATTAMSDGLRHIVNAMKSSGVHRLTVCLSAFLFWEREKLNPMFLALTEEHERMLGILNGITDDQFHWVGISPPHIAAEDPVGFGRYLVEEGRVPSEGARKISKFDLGDFLVRALWLPEFSHKHVGMARPNDSV